MREASLMSEPVVRLSRKSWHTPLAKKIRSAARGRGFFRNRLDSIFAVLVEGSLVVRIGPGASGTVDAFKLIEVRKCRDAADKTWLFQGDFGGFEDGP